MSSILERIRFSPRLRALRTVKGAVRPNAKKDIAAEGSGYLRHALRSKKRSVVFASYPSSGWNWTYDVLSFALGKHYTGDFKVAYNEAAGLKQAEVKPFRLAYPADARAQNAIPLTSALPGIGVDYCYHTHGFFGESPLLRLPEARGVIITRDYITALYSGYSKRRQVYATFREFVEKSGGLERIVRFYNSWGRQMSKNERVAFFRYEDLRKDPVAGFSDVIAWAFGERVKPEIVREAVDYYSFDKQKEREYKFSGNEKAHFHYKGKTDYRDEIGEDVYLWLKGELDRRIDPEPWKISRGKRPEQSRD